MVQVTPSAITVLKQYLHKKDHLVAVRIDVVILGSSWKSLALRLDIPKSEDHIFKLDDVTFLIKPDLLSACGSINIDYANAELQDVNLMLGGFSISSKTPLSNGLM